ncbi:RING finger protein 32 [Blyttiomyces sp. JEL0837]|nr:RING finger protein 32 [Blyttiomyces sp. JEL0837]
MPSPPMNLALWAAALQSLDMGTQHPVLSEKSILMRQRSKWKKQQEAHNKKFLLPHLETTTERALKPLLPKLGLGPDQVISRPKKVTLAHKLGILETPKSLSEMDWGVVKDKARKMNEGYRADCAICCESFGVRPQQCLKAYERHINAKKCPLCRQAEYEVLSTSDAAISHITRCATKIQATWRMWRERKKYLNYRQTTMPTQPVLRNKYCVQKLADVNRELSIQVVEERWRLDDFFKELDKTIQTSRSVCSRLDAMDEESNLRKMAAGVYGRTQHPLLEQCPICLGGLSGNRKIAVLSCTHIIHSKCLKSFESFAEGVPTCPICRSTYTCVNVSSKRFGELECSGGAINPT